MSAAFLPYAPFHRKIAARLLVSFTLISSLVDRTTLAEDWPQFRGPGGQGISADKVPPLQWSATQNIAWQTPLSGTGWSSPICWHENVFVTLADDEGKSCRLLCLARDTGKIVWNVEVFKQDASRKESKNSWATPTPATDGQCVYVAFPGGLAAVTFDGKIAWTNQDFPFYSRHGLGASPRLYKDLVILPEDGSNPVQGSAGAPPPEEFIGWQKPWDRGFVLALSKQTGKVKWKAPRNLMTRISHVTPLVIDVQGHPELISPAGDYIEAFNPDTGVPLWWVKSHGETPVPSVVYGGGLLFTTSGFEQETIRAIRPAGLTETGDLTATHIAWESRKAVPMMPSFIYVDEGDPLLFSVKESGIAQCREPQTGKTLWQERLDGAYSASPIAAAGKLFFLSEAGKMTIIDASRTFHVVAENTLDGPCQASPALSDGRLYIRTGKTLYCIRQTTPGR